MDILDAPTTDRPADTAERPTYSHADALAGATEYFEGDTLAAGVWLNKYALKDSFGNIYERSPDDMHRRIAAEMASVSNSKYPNPMPEEDVLRTPAQFPLPRAAGQPDGGHRQSPFQVVSLSNCFVIGVQGSADSYGAILKMDEEQVQLMKRRGGVGQDLSHLRPAGTP
jgi:ribonucleoside-diphosphate reductase alpha chain